MKLGIYEVGIIPQSVKQQYLELQAFSQWQYLGKNTLSTVLISLLDYFIAYDKYQAIENLAKPKSSYQNAYNIKISQFIYSLLSKKITPKEFFTQLKLFDSSNDRGGNLLEEFCYLQGLKKIPNNLNLLIQSIANFFSISINFIRQNIIGNSSKSKILILQSADGHFLIKQSSPLIQYINPRQQICQMCSMRYDDYFITQCLHICCNKCLNDKIKKTNQQLFIVCSNTCMQKIHIKDVQQYLSKELNTQKQQQEYSINLTKSQQFTTNDNSKSNPNNPGVENQKINSVYCNNFIDSRQQQQQKCNYCQQSNANNKFFINNSCGHKFCTDCFKRKVMTKTQQCPVKDCYRYVDLQLYQQRVQLEQEATQNQQPNYPQNQQPNYPQNQQPIQPQNQQFARCSKCKSEYSLNSLYKDKRCIHFTCFSCIQVQVQKLLQNQPNQIIITCPSCNNIYGGEFEKFYDQSQLRLVEERIKYDEKFQKEDKEREIKEKQQQQKLQQQQQEELLLQQQSPQKKVEKYPYGGNDTQKQQSQIQSQNDKQNNSSSVKDLVEQKQPIKIKEGLNQQEQGECTMCFTQFSEFNLRQDIDCQYHAIGVCCRTNCDRCPQCEAKNANPRSIRIKPKLALQTFTQKVEFLTSSNIYNSSIKQYNYGNADDYSRLNSRFNVVQSQIKSQQRNSTMDNNLFRSQGLQSNVVSVYGAGYKY
ncbi:unnamed protein product (macronuclear) [Paramecium tetraurelia]|uniref:RING-type domain-containing protein n=1 Tax=Paramecium tetraurelia TaxID=5888 RepID=A0CTT7_PARTE|nr:uncharacterized protein GSPATT00010438001 [Paramecium tetraurelia]CAK74204.1 unnamed protein product [Paramecium tetraurelia]|eukprot:XP_001441601.1 hypothetical protein (macronuclear) [Paramecium tetraurelia strain d4-2]